MLVAAALVPETALLVPGVSGADDVLPGLRSIVLAAVGDLVAARPDRVVVVAAAHPSRPDAVGHGHRRGGRHDSEVVRPPEAVREPEVVHRTGPLHPTLGAAGLDDARLGWSFPARSGSAEVRDVAPAVGLHLLARGGWDGATEVVVVPPDARLARRVGGDLTAGRTALLLVGSLSARRGPDGPLPDDERAAEVDERVLADLSALGGPDDAADAAARRRLTQLTAATASELAISAWAPWQVLCAATDGGRWRSTQRWVGAPFGATYAVVSWEPL